MGPETPELTHFCGNHQRLTAPAARCSTWDRLAEPKAMAAQSTPAVKYQARPLRMETRPTTHFFGNHRRPTAPAARCTTWEPLAEPRVLQAASTRAVKW